MKRGIENSVKKRRSRDFGGIIFPIEIVSLGMDGEGIARLGADEAEKLGFPREEHTCFVPFALVGEIVNVRVIRKSRNLLFCRITKLCSESPLRVSPKCSVFRKCGGCRLQHMDYATQLEVKRSNVATLLSKNADLGGAVVASTVASAEQYAYRNKLQMPVGEANGETVFGFYAEGTHKITPTESCPLHGEWSTRLIAFMRDFMRQHGIEGYNEATRSGIVRHVVARHIDGKTLVVIVLGQNPSSFPATEELARDFLGQFPRGGLYFNVNVRDTNVVMSNDFRHVCGEKLLSAKVFGVEVLLHPNSFFQINTPIMERIYEDVIRLCGGGDEETAVIDAYSGAGLLTAVLARRFGEAYGIEIVSEATDDANRLAEANGLSDRMNNICGDCAEVLPKLCDRLRGEGKRFCIILDPPRKGCDGKVLEAILRTEPDKVIYVSCNPATLSRDLKVLCKRADSDVSYEMTYCTPYDMFPCTKHVETVVALNRVKQNA